MAQVKVIEFEQSISNKDINDFEKKYRISLPSEYIEFLKKNNGGVPICKNWKNGDKELLVHGFYSLKYGELCLEDAFDDLINQDVIPSYLIPFAFDPFGNVFCISNDKTDLGTIYRWVHDTAFDPIEEIAKSLNEFLTSFEDE